ncbi:hypothetical protein NFI96_013958 [Prochilodus magdalenae]|nr:hypothetical protein NFI96_013958 [Prochilodus magdalenae]
MRDPAKEESWTDEWASVLWLRKVLPDVAPSSAVPPTCPSFISLSFLSSRFGRKNKEDKAKAKAKLGALSEEEVDKSEAEMLPHAPEVDSSVPNQAPLPDVEDDDFDPNYARINNFREPPAASYSPYMTRTPSPHHPPPAAAAHSGPPPSDVPLEGLYAKVNKLKPAATPADSNEARLQQIRNQLQHVKPVPSYAESGAGHRVQDEHAPPLDGVRSGEVETSRLLSLYRTDPTAITTDIQPVVVSSMSHPVSASTIGRRLHHAGLHVGELLQRLPLTPCHRHQRQQWGRTRLSWSDPEWQRVIFSDESCFSLGGDAQRICVRKHRGQHPNAKRPGVTPPPPYRTICRNCVRLFKLHGMDYHRTPLGTSTAPYRDVMSFGDGPFQFLQDCTPVHKASSIQTWMSEFGVGELDWPALSPDLHPIEHLWDELEWRLRARPSRPTSGSDLTNALLEEWSRIPTTLWEAFSDELKPPHNVHPSTTASEGGWMKLIGGSRCERPSFLW